MWLGEIGRKAYKLGRLAQHREYRAALRFGVAAAIEHETLAFAHDFATVIDVGASRGQFALFARRRFPSATLLCFEPIPGPRRTLKKVIASAPNARVFDVAVGAVEEMREMHISRSDDSSSLLPITERQVAAFPATDEIGAMPIRTVRLDKALRPEELTHPTLLKIDVQGAELDVLRGADGLLGHIDEIVVECSFVELYAGQALADDVVVHLRERGFRLTGLAAPITDACGRCLQSDLIFGRDVS